MHSFFHALIAAVPPVFLFLFQNKRNFLLSVYLYLPGAKIFPCSLLSCKPEEKHPYQVLYVNLLSVL